MKKVSHKKKLDFHLVQFFLILFIILNIIDFLNLFYIFQDFGNDLDIFKKILSWFLIAGIFYKSSPSKLFIGVKNKIVDFGLIISFVLVSTVEDIISLVYQYDINNLVLLKPLFFWSTFDLIKLESFLFFTGLITMAYLIIWLYKAHKPVKKSFIGSIVKKDIGVKTNFKLIVTIFFALFFAMTVFDLFMDWFAIKVDAMILVFGLIYYLFVFIKRHTKGKASSYLSNITNTGSVHFQNIINTFSSKETIFVGMAIILSIHLIVDVGLYIFPYSTGLSSNQVNFESINQENLALFNLIPSSDINTRFHQDINLSNTNPVTILFIFLSYLIVIIIGLFTFLAPYFILNNRFQNKKVKTKKTVDILMLLAIIFYSVLLVSAFLNSPIEPPKINSETYEIQINTNTLFNKEYRNLLGDQVYFNILFLVASMLGIYYLLLRVYSKIKYSIRRIVISAFMMYFIFYIVLIGSSIVVSKLDYITSSENEKILIENSKKYERVYNLYQNKGFHTKIISVDTKEIKNIENFLKKEESIDIKLLYSLKKSVVNRNFEITNMYLVVTPKNLSYLKSPLFFRQDVILKNPKEQIYKNYVTLNSQEVVFIPIEKDELTIISNQYTSTPKEIYLREEINQYLSLEFPILNEQIAAHKEIDGFILIQAIISILFAILFYFGGLIMTLILTSKIFKIKQKEVKI